MDDTYHAASADSARPSVRSTELAIPVTTLAIGWQTALVRPPKIDTTERLPRPPRPGVVSVPIGNPLIRISSFTFPDTSSQAVAALAACSVVGRAPIDTIGRRVPSADPSANKHAPPLLKAPIQFTRVKPPSDVVKLGDRLFYLLQPPLEAVISSGAIYFPFEPFPYQMEGIAFLYPRCHAVLADEMGLGKTMQAITAMRLLLHAGEIRRVLLVCPKPLVTNWQRELHMWAPEIPLTIVEGSQERRQWQWGLADAVVTIANYELLMRDRQALTAPGMHFDLMVLDESQRIKNRNGATSEIVRSVSRTRSWALTGTPVENSPEDLVGIFEFVSPGYLRTGMRPRAIGKAVGQHVLRRTKDKVLTDLPPKMFRDAELDLTPEQRRSYHQAEDEGVVQLSGLGQELTIHHVFELVLRLKQICNFDPATGESAKLERLEADLEECAASGRKAIVFSQWVDTIYSMRDRLQRFNPLEYHGQIPSKKRDAVIERFRQDKNAHVLLMSYGAGAVGLNLQFASYVFLFDRWWNPAVEDQAINRAHRIGAAGPVTVTRFISLNTIEQRIDEILRQKRELFDLIFAESDTQWNLGFTQQEIFGLFNLRTPKGPMGLAA